MFILESDGSENDEPPSFLNEDEADLLEEGDSAKAIADIIPLHQFKNNDRNKEESEVKEFTSSISCRWKEDVDDREVYYTVVCYEGENRVHIEIQGQEDGKPAVMSFEGLKNLMNWVDSKAKPMFAPTTLEAARRS